MSMRDLRQNLFRLLKNLPPEHFHNSPWYFSISQRFSASMRCCKLQQPSANRANCSRAEPSATRLSHELKSRATRVRSSRQCNSRENTNHLISFNQSCVVGLLHWVRDYRWWFAGGTRNNSPDIGKLLCSSERANSLTGVFLSRPKCKLLCLQILQRSSRNNLKNLRLSA